MTDYVNIELTDTEAYAIAWLLSELDAGREPELRVFVEMLKRTKVWEGA